MQDWVAVERLVRKLNLDDAGMTPEQFMVCMSGDMVRGIGRIQQHAECLELCSLGVDEPFRGQGIGRSLVVALLHGLHDTVYVVTDIPAYFAKLGFLPSAAVMPSLEDKRRRCIEQLACNEPLIMERHCAI